MAKRPPVLHEESDATIDETAQNTWIGVKNFSVNIAKTDEGVVVDIYAKGYEDCDCLASCYAFDMDALFMQEETDEEKDLEVD
jgi:hypothetical protein